MISKPDQFIKKKYKCEKCKDMGIIIEGRFARICDCKIKENNLKRLKKSGMYELIANVKPFKTTEQFQKEMKNKANEFIKQREYPFFYISGNTGGGKTHLCTLICKSLLESNLNVLYKRFSSLKHELIKDMKNNEETTLQSLKEIDVLYLDDFAKTEMTSYLRDNIFDILDYRYSKKKITIMSSEKSLREIQKIDDFFEALVGRIVEEGRRFIINIGNDKKRNQRLKV